MGRNRYKDASEVIKSGFQEQESNVQLLENAIQEGIESGVVTDFNPRII